MPKSKDIVIFDLDGTLADCSHRIHHIQKPGKDWRAFFADCHLDAPIKANIDMLHAMWGSGFDIWIVSGRSDECREATEKWLAQHLIQGGDSYKHLIMRKKGDFTDDHILNPSWLKDGTIPAEEVFCVFDDRARVVKGWRDAGMTCYQVNDGDF